MYIFKVTHQLRPAPEKVARIKVRSSELFYQLNYRTAFAVRAGLEPASTHYEWVTEPQSTRTRKPYFWTSLPATKSAMTPGTAVSMPTTSSIPASSGLAIVNSVEVMPTTTSFAAIPDLRR